MSCPCPQCASAVAPLDGGRAGAAWGEGEAAELCSAAGGAAPCRVGGSRGLGLSWFLADRVKVDRWDHLLDVELL